jgi:hypothetical protein
MDGLVFQASAEILDQTGQPVDLCKVDSASHIAEVIEKRDRDRAPSGFGQVLPGWTFEFLGSVSSTITSGPFG